MPGLHAAWSELQRSEWHASRQGRGWDVGERPAEGMQSFLGLHNDGQSVLLPTEGDLRGVKMQRAGGGRVETSKRGRPLIICTDVFRDC